MLYICLTYFSLVVPLRAHLPDGNVPDLVTVELRVMREAGYFFALRQVPLGQKEYIFRADPLKRAVYITRGETIPLSYTMTVKKSRGFDMYFSATDYSIILSVKGEKVIDQFTSEYQGNLLVRHGRDKDRFAVHGIYVR